MRMLFLAVLVGFSGVSQAASLNIDANGLLLGANGVEVDGVLYDVNFVSGTCIEVFGGCDENSDFFFQDEAAAAAASQALLDQVFLDGVGGSFDSDPTLTAGCPGNSSQPEQFCRVRTIYSLDPNSVGRLLVISADNYELEMNDSVNPTFIFDISDTTVSGLTVFADWSVAAPVPAPAALPLLLGALGMLGFFRSRG